MNEIIHIGVWTPIPLISGSIIYDDANRADSPIRDDIEETFKSFPAVNHVTTAISVSIGSITINTPKPVATPFPPSNFKNG